MFTSNYVAFLKGVWDVGMFTSNYVAFQVITWPF
jgi:hypothetical protein